MYRIRLEIISPDKQDETPRLLKVMNCVGATSMDRVAEFKSYKEAADARRLIMACWPKMEEIMLALNGVRWLDELLLEAENAEDGIEIESDKDKKKKPGPKPTKKATKKRGPGRPKNYFF